MNTQSLILGILSFGDATGYEIKKHSSEGAFSFFVDISYGTIYPTLARLESEGMVTSRSESQSGKPDKKIYSISEKGRAEFIRMLDVIPQPDKFKSEFLLISMCAGLCSGETICRALDKQIEDIRKVLKVIEDMRGECVGDPASHWVCDYGIHMQKAALQYLTENRQSLIDIANSQLQHKDAAE